MAMCDPYKILGVSPHCSDEELKRAYREQSKRWHPDANQGHEQMATERFRLVREAFEQIEKERRAGGRMSYAYAGRSYGSAAYGKSRYGTRDGNKGAGPHVDPSDGSPFRWESKGGRAFYRLDQAANLLWEGRYEDAYHLLRKLTIEEARSEAFWYYCKAFAAYKTEHFKEAKVILERFRSQYDLNADIPIIDEISPRKLYGMTKAACRKMEGEIPLGGFTALGIGLWFLNVFFLKADFGHAAVISAVITFFIYCGVTAYKMQRYSENGKKKGDDGSTIRMRSWVYPRTAVINN